MRHIYSGQDAVKEIACEISGAALHGLHGQQRSAPSSAGRDEPKKLDVLSVSYRIKIWLHCQAIPNIIASIFSRRTVDQKSPTKQDSPLSVLESGQKQHKTSVLCAVVLYGPSTQCSLSSAE